MEELPIPNTIVGAEVATPAPSLTTLPDSILLLILETASNVTTLTRTCRRLHHLWSLPSIRANWLLRVTTSSNKVEALDISISLFRDLRVAANLIDRWRGFTGAWLAHVMVDAVRGEPCAVGAGDGVWEMVEEDEEGGDLKEVEWRRHPFHGDSRVMFRPAPVREKDECCEENKEVMVMVSDEVDRKDDLGHLIQSMIKAGADLDLDPSTSGPSFSWMHHASHRTRSGIPISGTTLLSWILNESLRSTGGIVTCGLSCLLLAAGSGHEGACRVLLESGRVDVRGLEDLAICVACQGGWERVVKVLIEYGADVDAREGMPMRVRCWESGRGS
ncbi:hypothetical protein BC829DRAFT_443134 [Chytridium lagenaria]|nr:hypothetical protein BC829DRAFT_443134 [Chytridium lagenaria]